jgi:hypothetical protein
MKKTEDNLREDVPVFDMLAEYGAWAVVAGVVAEVGYALVYPEGKTWPQIWVPVIASGLVAFGVIVEIFAAGTATEARDALDRISNEKVAAAELKAAELENANLRLRKELGPRHINTMKFAKALEGLPKAPVEIMYVRDEKEAWNLAQHISSTLMMAGWQCSTPQPIIPPDTRFGNMMDSAQCAGGSSAGVCIVPYSVSPEESKAVSEAFIGNPVTAETPLIALIKAVRECDLSNWGYSANGKDAEIPVAPGCIRIVVAQRG